MPELVGKQIGPIGFGMMGLTINNPLPSNEQSFQAMRAALENGCNFWNAGEFYGTPDWNSLTLLAAYFKKYPDDAKKVVLSVKGAFDFGTMRGFGSPEEIQRSINKILKDLDGTKNIDIFECGRVDPEVPIETTMRHLDEEYVKKGIIGGVALSEVRGETVRRAAKVTKIVGVEVELSLWSTHVLENGVADACGELGIPLIAYSPIGKGMLSGEIRSLDDLPANDGRRMYPRFQPENFSINIQLVDEVRDLAKKKGCTPAQLAINWTRSLSAKPGMPVIIPIPGATTEGRVYENAQLYDLTAAEVSAIDEILSKYTIAGERYPVVVPVDG